MHDITLYKGFHTSSTNMTDWKITIFKHEMYIFIHVFHCHVSFRGGISCHTTMTHYYGCDMAVSQDVLKILSSFFLILKLMYLLLDIWEGHWFEFEVPISVGSTTQLPQAANYLLAQALAISSFKLGSKNMFCCEENPDGEISFGKKIILRGRGRHLWWGKIASWRVECNIYTQFTSNC